jgi:para-nitrobenzyl esterase
MVRKVSVAFVFAGVIAGLSLAARVVSARGQNVPDACLATTALGQVRGLEQGGACSYFAIPFAEAPIGNLRWKPPQPKAPWTAVLDARVAPARPNCGNFNRANNLPEGNEDCLKVNVWAPTRPRTVPAPVIVWFHTGAFVATGRQNGRRFAEERGVVIVAPNYRIGPLGFLAHSALTLEDPAHRSSGAYGLLDQRAALAWVRDHIAAFGGDPRNVTIDGTSAGSNSVSLHLVSPGSAGLFHRAVMQSGYASSMLSSAAEAEAQGDEFARKLGCTDQRAVLACLRAKTMNEVLTALPIGQQEFVERPRTDWTPGVDGVVIPDQPRELYWRGEFARVPLLIGANSDEGWTYVDRSFPAGLTASEYAAAVTREFGGQAPDILEEYPAARFPTPKDALARLTGDAEMVCEARRVARFVQKTGTPVYLYSFEYQVAAIDGGRASHGLESNFLFGNNFVAGGNVPSNHVLNANDLTLFSAMSGYWARFAERGDPNDPGSPVQWPRFVSDGSASSDRHLVLDTTIGIGSFLRDEYCNFWEHYFFRSLAGAVPASQP